MRSSPVPPPRRAVIAAMLVIYGAWGAAYPALRIMVASLPPWLGASIRFALAAAALLALLALRGGAQRLRIPGRQLASCVLVGVLLMVGAQGLIAAAAPRVPASLAALVAASAPLWIVALRCAAGERVPRATLGGVAVGFAAVAGLVGGRGGGEVPIAAA